MRGDERLPPPPPPKRRDGEERIEFLARTLHEADEYFTYGRIQTPWEKLHAAGKDEKLYWAAAVIAAEPAQLQQRPGRD